MNKDKLDLRLQEAVERTRKIKEEVLSVVIDCKKETDVLGVAQALRQIGVSSMHVSANLLVKYIGASLTLKQLEAVSYMQEVRLVRLDSLEHVAL